MNEKPKSIWKKSFTGRNAVLIWVLLTVVVLLLGILIPALVSERPIADCFGMAAEIGLLGVAVCFIIIYVAGPVLRCLFWKHWRWTLFGLACLAALVALFYAEEDWRGKHDWNQFKHQWEARGEHFDFASIVPPPVPDDQNFAFSPVWIAEDKSLFYNTPERAKAWYGDRIYSEEVSNIVTQLPISVSALVGTNWAYRLPRTPEVSGNWATSRMTDLKPWQSYYRDLEMTNPAAEISITPQPQTPAQDVLLALSKFDPLIEKLRQDSARPYSRFPLGYGTQPPAEILLPHLGALKSVAQVLQLRAIAELQNGKSKSALDDIKFMLRLTDSIHSEPFLISHLVGIGILQMTIQPVYEGLAKHQWSDAQLAELDAELAKLDFLADHELAVRGERAMEIANIEFIRHPDLYNPRWKQPRFYFLAPIFSPVHMLSDLSGPGSDENSKMGFQLLALGLGPSGWLVQNELRIARFDTKWYLPIVDQETKTISPAKVHAAGDALGKEIRHRTPENILETLFIPNWHNAAEKFAYAQSSANLARTAIALERFRLAHGDYPESLDALAPQFMEKVPHDVIGGGPLHYRRTSDGQFVLYSVGWNETDDGGKIVLYGSLSKNALADISKGDWVWRYPPK
jgi:hypothetical protein